MDPWPCSGLRQKDTILLAFLRWPLSLWPREQALSSQLAGECCISANFFSVKCVRFFVSTESEFPKIYRQRSKIAEDFERLPKIAKGFQWLPKIFRRLPKITEGVERFSTTSKQSWQWFLKDFQPILSIIKESKYVLTTSQTSKDNWMLI